MWLIIGFLALGILIGYKGLLSENLNRFNNYLTMGGLFLLLFTMGVKMGINQQIISNLNSLGLKAIILALGSVLGSVILVFIFELRFNRRD